MRILIWLLFKQQSEQDFLPDLITAYSLGNSHAGIVLADYYLSEIMMSIRSEKMNQAKANLYWFGGKRGSVCAIKVSLYAGKRIRC